MSTAYFRQWVWQSPRHHTKDRDEGKSGLSGGKNAYYLWGMNHAWKSQVFSAGCISCLLLFVLTRTNWSQTGREGRATFYTVLGWGERVVLFREAGFAGKVLCWKKKKKGDMGLPTRGKSKVGWNMHTCLFLVKSSVFRFWRISAFNQRHPLTLFISLPFPCTLRLLTWYGKNADLHYLWVSPMDSTA